MASVSVASQPATASGGLWRAIIWGLRVAVLAALVDIFVGKIDQIPNDYYARLQSKYSVLLTRGREDSGRIGHTLVVVGVVLLAFVFAYLLARRPFWYRRRAPAAGTPIAAAIAATTTVFLAWTALVILMSVLTGFPGEPSFKYSGALLGVLLLHTLAFLYVGFVSASGDYQTSGRAGAFGGLICGLAVGVAWSVYDFFIFDATYATIAAVARIVVFGALGFWAGGQGAALALTPEGVGRPRAARQRSAARPAAPGRFRINGTIAWIAVGLLLATVFLPKPYSPIDAAMSGDLVPRIGQFFLGALQAWLAILVVAAVVVALVVGLRWAWPRLANARHAAWTGILYVLALGGAGDRTRSRGYQRLLLAAALVLIFLWPHLDPYLLGPASDGRISTLSDMGRYVILALGLNIVVGFAGLLDLGYVAFFAFGAYSWALIGSPAFNDVTAQFHRLSGLPLIPRALPFGLQWAWLFWPMLLIGALVAAGFGILLGRPTLRLRGDYLAIVTLGFGEIVPIVFKNMPKLTQGSNGIAGTPSPIVPGIAFPWFSTTPFYYLMLALIAMVVLANIRLRDSRIGRSWVALREDEIAAAATGINTVKVKLLAFATGAFFSGMAGVFHGAKLGVVSPDNFAFGDSIIYLAMVVLGGLGSIPGVILGALIIASLNLYILPQAGPFFSGDPNSFLFALHNIDFASYRSLIFGGMLVAMMLLRPEGLIPSARRRAELHGEVAAETPEPVEDTLDAAVGGPVYEEQRVE